jgi:hypothetical protein
VGTARTHAEPSRRSDHARVCARSCSRHSPALRPWIVSDVEGLWSPVPRRCRKNRRLKQQPICLQFFCAQRRGAFLS